MAIPCRSVSVRSPDAVLQSLGDRRDLGLHTEMFTDGVMHMIRSGNITGARKTLHPYKVASSIIMGSRELYDFIDGNEMIEMYPVDHMNDPYVVGQNDNMVSINSCLEIEPLRSKSPPRLSVSTSSVARGDRWTT